MEFLTSSAGNIFSALAAFPAGADHRRVSFMNWAITWLVGGAGSGRKCFRSASGANSSGVTDRHGTRWKLSLIPLGGYVKFLGDENAASLPTGGGPSG
jgi:regulator of sigma E protease